MKLIEKIQKDLVDYVSVFYQDMSWDLETEDLQNHYARLAEHIEFIRKIDTIDRFTNLWMGGKLEDHIGFVDGTDEGLEDYLEKLINQYIKN